MNDGWIRSQKLQPAQAAWSNCADRFCHKGLDGKWPATLGIPSPQVAWLCVAWPAAGADKPTVVELWPGKVPDETGTIGAEKSLLSPKLDRKQVEVTEPTRMVTNVTRPTLTIYRPAKDKDNGTAV